MVLLARLWDWIAGAMSSQMHNFSIFICLTVWAGAVVSVLMSPHPLRLDMAKDVGVVLMGLLGIVGGTHAYKAARGVEGGSKAPIAGLSGPNAGFEDGPHGRSLE